jgi:hypothetical protein
MNRNIWIGIVVAVALIAGGWGYFNQSSAPTTLEATQQDTSAASQPTIHTPKPVATQTNEDTSPYYLNHAGKTVYKSTDSFTKEAAKSECIKRISQYTDNGSSSCWWKLSFKGDGDELLYEVKSNGADLEVRNVSVQYPTLQRNGTQHIRLEVINIGNYNNAASPSQFAYNVSIEAVNSDGSYVPLGKTVKGMMPVPAPQGISVIEVDVPASEKNNLTGQLYSTFRAYIFVNSDGTIDEQGTDDNNDAKSSTWTITD